MNCFADADDPLSLTGQVALVTGGSRGIGLAIAKLFVARGAKVMMVSRSMDALNRAVAEIGAGTAVFAAHVGDPDQIAAAVASCVERFGRLDILVNNAGTNPYFGPIVDVDLPRYDKTWDVNVRGALLWTQEAWRAWMREHGGRIVNVASIGAMVIEPGIGVYNGTKAALVYLTRTLAAELAPLTRVNAIAPGLVKTEFSRTLWERNESARARAIPLQRLGVPGDVANAALFLASDMSAWITGHVLTVDGGSSNSTAGRQRERRPH